MRALILTTVVATTIGLAACSNTSVAAENDMSNPFCQEGRTIPGGWYDGEINGQVEVALDFVLARMNSAAGLDEILAVKTQVVAGTNIAIDFRLDNGELWNAWVYRDLQGNFEMTKPAQRGSMTDTCK